MTTKVTALESRLKHWSGIVRERVESGLSIREYCKRSGFHENAFYYWQRKLRDAAAPMLKNQESALESFASSPAPSGWVAVSPVSENSAKGDTSPVIIEVNHFRLTIATETDMDLLAKVCRTLVSL